MKRIFLLLIILGLCDLSIAQNRGFNKAFPIKLGLPAESFSIMNESMGFIVYGVTVDSVSHEDVSIVKIDSIGNRLWAKTYPIKGYDFINNAVENEIAINVPWGGEIGTGVLANDTILDYDWALFRFDSKGDTIWTKNYKDSSLITVNQIKITREKKYLLYSQWTDTTDPLKTIFTIALIKTDTLGNKIWTKTYHASMNHLREAYGMDTCRDGGYILCAYDYDTITDFSKTACRGGRIMVMKTDSAGKMQWIKYIANPLCDVIGYSIHTLTNGGYVVCGLWDDSLSSGGDIAWSKMYMVKLNDTGSVIWANQYGAIVAFEGSSLLNIKELHNNSDLVACGSTSIGYILRTDSNGNQKWLRNYTEFFPRSYDYLSDIQLTTDGGFIASGYTYDNPEDFWVVKTDSLGCDTVGCNYNTGTEELSTQIQNVRVYPNPNIGQFTISISNINEKCSVEIYNVMGQNVETQCIASLPGLSINLTGQPNGVYFYRVIREDARPDEPFGRGGLVGEGKLIIQK